MNVQPTVQYPQFKIHNRTGSAQFTLQPAYFAGDTFTSQAGEVQVMQKGHVMVEMANAIGQTDARGHTVYDWANKMTMKLSDSDLHQILAGLEGHDCKIIHDPNKARGAGALPKSCLQMSKGERFGYFMTMSRGENKAACPVSDTDADTFRRLMARAVVRIYGW